MATFCKQQFVQSELIKVKCLLINSHLTTEGLLKRKHPLQERSVMIKAQSDEQYRKMNKMGK